MRLICPNCGAQYEVPVDVIPTGGRDVQCSDCGHTWFQLHPDDAPGDLGGDLGGELSGDPVAEEASADEAQSAPASYDDALDDSAEPADLGEAPDEEPEDAAEDDTPEVDHAEIDHAGINEFAAELRAALAARDGYDVADHPAPQLEARAAEPVLDPPLPPEEVPVPRRPSRAARGLDPSVAEVLRQEAAREARRRTDADPLESQPELGLGAPEEDEAARRARDARTHMARIRGDAPLSGAEDIDLDLATEEESTADTAHDPFAPEPEHPALANSRRELLPDIEEVNQTLRVSTEPRRMETAQGRALDAEEEEQQGSNFARGFGLMLILAVLAVLIYALAPVITGAVPALAPLIDPYVAAVDGLRLWLDGQLAALIG
ncbi:zinc-ribbon domain-containing protein [Alloyangia pacifica]|uniref:zinc-ribbon domain-containing protein n=1 Tax=Alloyangia pacifica TaxID=311180 RepID=UPI001CD2BA1E|nr:zinc-ribbon domain-containing protein [Alloyangia pacifica]MCA0994048.1 zinc-ribbon domain-containing protein [Alloyangia pacifica]